MKIAMIGQKGMPAIYGGVETHVESLATNLVKQGHEVLVYTRKWYSPMRPRKINGVKVIYTPTIHTKHLDAIIHTFTSTIHAVLEKADVIHYHGVGPALLSWLPKLLRPKTKIIATFHCIDRYHQKWGPFSRLMLALGERAICHFPDETIAVSKTIQDYCIKEFGKVLTYVPNGVSVETTPTNPELLREWDLQPNKYFLMVSRLVRHKGAHYLIEAWQFARRQNPELFKDFKLVLVGGSAFTEKYIEELKHVAGGDKTIVFTGWQNGKSLEALYDNTLMLVHPSENEGLPMSVLQAMSYSKPVLVSDIPEHKEVVIDSGFWFENTRVYSLANKIIELTQNPDLLKEAGLKNQVRAKQFYNWKDIVEETIKVYERKKNEHLEWQTAEI